MYNTVVGDKTEIMRADEFMSALTSLTAMMIPPIGHL